MKKQLAFSLIWLLLPVAQLLAQEYIPVKDLEHLKKKLKVISLTINSITADFVQEKHLSVLLVPAVSSGKFYYSAENMVRWEVTTPDPYLVIINGAFLTVVENAKTKRFDTKTNKMYGKINELMIGSIKGTLGDDNKKYGQAYFESSSHFQMKLFPLEKMAKKYLEEIQIFFEKTDYHVSTIKMIEPGGDFTIIHFFNKSINGQLNEGLFIIE
jgi:outer membrane lipoprotein-sorting protein